MTTRVEQLTALRKSAPANTKLTVSRGARSHRRPPRDTYAGTGNIHALVRQALPNTATIAQLKSLTEAVHVFAETENNGDTPNVYTIKQIANTKGMI